VVTDVTKGGGSGDTVAGGPVAQHRSTLDDAARRILSCDHAVDTPAQPVARPNA